MKREECSGTLLMRSRQGAITAAERLALQAHVLICESCRVDQAVMNDFDADAITDRHDAVRIQRLAALAQRFTRERTSQRPRHVAAAEQARQHSGRRRFSEGGPKQTRIALLAAALFLVVAGASGAVLVQNVVRNNDAKSQVDYLEEPFSAPVSERLQRAGRVALAPVASAELIARAKEAESEESPCTAGGNCAASDAASVFKRANQARREGRTRAALALYQTLQRQHPKSREAQLSHLSMGHLLLNGGNASNALDQFTRALRASAASPVQAEALYGKGLALARLGRSAEERSTWRTLLQEFPSSPYAGHAKRRLGDEE